LEYWKSVNEDGNECSDTGTGHLSYFFAKYIFLEYFHCFYKDVSCVYGVFKNTRDKRVTVVFRSSVSGRDWQGNFNQFHKKMLTPVLAKEETRESSKEHVFVHRGLYGDIFNNKELAEDHQKQRYNQIIEEITSLIGEGNPHGYKIYIAGHSLGAALATLVAFKLASSDPRIPKPITCITISSLRVGTASFRDAFTYLEQKGYLRCLRLINTRDLVPTLSPVTFGGLYFPNFFPGLYKHAGINVRFAADNFTLVHPEGLGFCSSITNALNTSLLKVVWVLHSFLRCQNPFEYHSQQLSIDRLNMHKNELDKMYINDLYNDPKIVGQEFVDKYKSHLNYSELVDDKGKKD